MVSYSKYGMLVESIFRKIKISAEYTCVLTGQHKFRESSRDCQEGSLKQYMNLYDFLTYFNPILINKNNHRVTKVYALMTTFYLLLDHSAMNFHINCHSNWVEA